MTSATRIGILVGAILALAWIAIGFWAAVLVAVAMAAGGLVGHVVDGKPDIRAILNGLRGRRSSS